MSGSALMAASGGVAGQRERADGHGIVMPEPRPFVLCRMAKLLEPRAGPADQRGVSFYAVSGRTGDKVPGHDQVRSVLTEHFGGLPCQELQVLRHA